MRRDAVLVLLVIGLFSLGAVAWGRPLLAFFYDQGKIQTWMASWGIWGPLASIALNVAQVLAAPIPGQAINIANGYVFGVWRGTLYSMAGVSLGSLMAMSLARRWGRAWIVRWLSSGQLATLDAWSRQRGTLFFIVVFLLPFVPDDLACFAIGLSPLPIPKLFVWAMLARFPGVLSSVWIGARAATLGPTEWVMVGLALAGLGWIAWRWMRSHK